MSEIVDALEAELTAGGIRVKSKLTTSDDSLLFTLDYQKRIAIDVYEDTENFVVIDKTGIGAVYHEYDFADLKDMIQFVHYLIGMKSEIIYVADLAGDIDDLVAIKYLDDLGVLHSVVLDGASEDNERKSILEKDGIEVVDEIPRGARIIFCGGAFTPIAKYLRTNTPDLIVANGFFAGSNIVKPENVLEKFKGMTQCPSYNPNLDWKSALEVINSGVFMLIVSKNVCHHPDNVVGKWHDEEMVKIKVPAKKKLHDLLMVREGLNFINDQDMLCSYEFVNIFMDKGASGISWCSELSYYSNILISVNKK